MVNYVNIWGSEMTDYSEFFDRMAGSKFETRFYENDESFQIEELYQAFKARVYSELKDDLIADVQKMLTRHGF